MGILASALPGFRDLRARLSSATNGFSSGGLPDPRAAAASQPWSRLRRHSAGSGGRGRTGWDRVGCERGCLSCGFNLGDALTAHRQRPPGFALDGQMGRQPIAEGLSYVVDLDPVEFVLARGARSLGGASLPLCAICRAGRKGSDSRVVVGFAFAFHARREPARSLPLVVPSDSLVWRGPRSVLAHRSRSAGHVRELSFSDVQAGPRGRTSGLRRLGGGDRVRPFRPCAVSLGERVRRMEGR